MANDDVKYSIITSTTSKVKKLAEFGIHEMRKPTLLAHSCYNRGKAYFFNDRRVRLIHVAVTNRCNLICEHCFASKLDQGKSKELTIGELDSIYLSGLKLGAFGYHITGGEPLLRDDIFEIIKVFRPQRSLVSMITNGKLLNEELIVAFKKAKLDAIVMSIDSADAQEHDTFRNSEGLFDHVIECIGIMRKVGIKTNICVTITDEIIQTQGFRDLIVLTKQLEAELVINYGVRMGKWENNENISFSRKSKELLMQIIRENPHVTREEMANYREWGCPAINEQFYITAFGDVIPCPYIHITFGNIREEPLEVIHKRCMEFTVFNGYPPLCLSGEDELFIKKIMPLTWVDAPPIHYAQIKKELLEIGEHYATSS